VTPKALGRCLQVVEPSRKLPPGLRAHFVECLERGAVVDFGALNLAFVIVPGENRNAHEHA